MHFLSNLSRFYPLYFLQRCSFNLTKTKPVSKPQSFRVSLKSPVDIVTLLYPAIATITLEPIQEASIALVEFASNSYTVDEQDGTVSIIVNRSGSLDQESVVMCFTEGNTAKAGEDFKQKRKKKRSSKIKFKPGDRVCASVS